MFRISTLEMFSLQETMFINADTLQSLQIVNAESHPNSHTRGPNSSSGAKEGLSVYGLFHHFASTPQGRTLLRQHFLRPSLNLGLINERLDTVGTFVRSENSSALDMLVQSLKRMTNMRTVMKNLEKGVGGSSSGQGGFSRSIWASIRGVGSLHYSRVTRILLTASPKFSFHALKIKDAFQDVVGGENLTIKSKVSHRRICAFCSYHLS
jgi:DNA mismatch repair protein MSH5